MGRRSPTFEPSAVLGTVKAAPPPAPRRLRRRAASGGGQEASLDGACARRSRELRSGRRNASRQSNKGIELKQGEAIEGFRVGHDTSPFRSEVPSPGRWTRSDRCPPSGTTP